MATIGYRAAVADAFGVKVTGVLAYLMWAFIHVLYLIGWGNRLGTLYTWARALVFSNNRGHRIITFEQAHSQVEHHHPQPPADTPVIEQTTPADGRAVGPAAARRPLGRAGAHRRAGGRLRRWWASSGQPGDRRGRAVADDRARTPRTWGSSGRCCWSWA